MTSPERELRELIAKWRAVVFDAEAHGYTMEDQKSCADELEKLLAAAPAPTPELFTPEVNALLEKRKAEMDAGRYTEGLYPAEPVVPERERQVDLAYDLAVRIGKRVESGPIWAQDVAEIIRPHLAAAPRAAGGQRTDCNEPLALAKQRVAIVERVMKLPYIKATRDTERGEERFVARDDLIKAVHDYATVSRAAPPPASLRAEEETDK